MGLLDAFNSDEGLLGLSLLAAAGPSERPASFGQRMAAGMGMYRKAKAEDEQMKLMRDYRDAQIAQMKSDAEQKELARKMLLGRQEILARGSTPISGGQAASMGGGPTNAAAQLVGQRPGFGQEDIARYLALGGDVKDIQALVESKDWGRREVARTIEENGPNGGKIINQYDKFGDRVGTKPIEGYVPMEKIDDGMNIRFARPGDNVSFAKQMTPGERASNAVALGNLDVSRQRLGFDISNALGERSSKGETELRKEFNDLPAVKNYALARPAYEAAVDALKRNTPQSDINLVYAIAKLYDPNSVVREGEYGTIASSQAIPDRIKGWAQYLQGGGRFTPETRAQIARELEGRHGVLRKDFDGVASQYADIAKGRGLDPINIIPRFDAAKPPTDNPLPLPASGKASDLQVNAVYETKKGPARWDGFRFVKVE